jgi:hypothetical protein
MSSLVMKRLINRNFAVLIILLVSLSACTVNDSIPYEDESHFSEVFNKEKEYRIYLPEHYFEVERLTINCFSFPITSQIKYFETAGLFLKGIHYMPS